MEGTLPGEGESVFGAFANQKLAEKRGTIKRTFSPTLLPCTLNNGYFGLAVLLQIQERK